MLTPIATEEGSCHKQSAIWCTVQYALLPHHDCFSTFKAVVMRTVQHVQQWLEDSSHTGALVTIRLDLPPANHGIPVLGIIPQDLHAVCSLT